MQTQDGVPSRTHGPRANALVQSDLMWAMDKVEVYLERGEALGRGLAPPRVLTAIIMDNYYNSCIYS